MDYILAIDWLSWFNLLVRFFHVVAGIAWIGSSFYFIWLDLSLRSPQDPKNKEAGVFGEVWSVHGGGFYQVSKFQNAPKKLPETLHWFKWESYATWLSGFFLLIIIYYFNSKLYLIDTEKLNLTTTQAILLSLGFLIIGWVVYDLLCRFLLEKASFVFDLFAFLLLCGLSYGLTHVFSSKAAFLHYGVVLGTIMAGNVFFIIIPNQKKIVAKLLKGEIPDPKLGKDGKSRSTHNNYLTLPVIFAMISGHYPLTFGHPYNWILLLVITFLSAFFRSYFNLKHKGSKNFWVLITSFILILTAIFVTDWTIKNSLKSTKNDSQQVKFSEVVQIVNNRCLTCHSNKPTFTGLTAAPNGLSYENPQVIKTKAKEIYQRVVVTKTMPLGNITNITEIERQIIKNWFEESL